MLTMSEAFRLHQYHCAGCSEYQNHGGVWTTESGVRVSIETPSRDRNAGFDSPPPPSNFFDRLVEAYTRDQWEATDEDDFYLINDEEADRR